eukprot:TRINITY_DN6441_c1_g1_i1.p1 TRINITY_DN6441_c1_g1~~TRINITY_DN6441_c1_g1_i1.p1  ORF type:complete len:1853 (+),score=450.05 TRINITY_DN6441_c1_g1_i1:50-5560(+)
MDLWDTESEATAVDEGGGAVSEQQKQEAAPSDNDDGWVERRKNNDNQRDVFSMESDSDQDEVLRKRKARRVQATQDESTGSESSSSDSDSDSDSNSSSSGSQYNYSETDSDDVKTPEYIDQDVAPKKKLELILGHRESPENNDVTEYLVKYIDYSYHHVEWLEEEDINSEYPSGRGANRKLVNYIEQHVTFTAQKRGSGRHNRVGEHFDPIFLSPEKIVAELTKSGITYLMVKWEALSYAEATWETLDFVKFTLQAQHLIAKFRSWSLPRPAPSFTREGKVNMYDLNTIVSRIQGFRFENDNRLRDYQVKGVSWLVHNWLQERSCILGDEMGLGKTVQVVIFLETLRRLFHVTGPFLVIAPLATIGHWQREAATWVSMNVVTYMGLKKARDRIFMNEFYYKQPASTTTKVRKTTPVKFDLLVTTYEWMQKDSARFNSIHWGATVIDEGHRLKNEDASLFKMLSPMKSEHRVVLTGTPVQNNITELYSLLKYLDPTIVPKRAEKFTEMYTPMTAENLETLFALLGPRLLRREKENVEKSIPPKVEILVKVGLTKYQKEVYKQVINKNRTLLEGGKVKPAHKNVCMELRKVCNHPWLRDNAENDYLQRHGFSGTGTAPLDFVMRHMVSCSGKLQFLDKLLEKFRKEGERVLLFSQFVIVLNLITDYLEWKGYPFETLSGNTASFERQRAVDRFQDPKSDSFLFLISTRAGGCGINLTSATKVIIYDSDWNPQNDLQAQARCHRIGQKKEVEVYRVLTENTYEERMFDVASQKLGLDRVVLSAADAGDTTTTTTMGLSTKEIERVLRHGAYDLYKNDDEEEEEVNEGIDQILERSKKIVHGAKDNTSGPAVRGLAGFSKVKFAGEEINDDDPDFWTKVLPEKLDSESLVRKLNGATPPSSSDDVSDFMSKLCTVCITEIEALGTDPLYKPDDLHTQRTLEGLVLQAIGLPQFETHVETLKGLQTKVHEPLTRVRKPRHIHGSTTPPRKKSKFADSDSEDDGPSKGMHTALGIWREKLLTDLVDQTKVFGYGRWETVTLNLQKASYPSVDMLPVGIRQGVVCAKLEGLAAYFSDEKLAEPAAKQAAPKKKVAMKKKTKKKKPAHDSDSDSDSSYSSSSSSSSSAPKQNLNLQEGLLNKFIVKPHHFASLSCFQDSMADYNISHLSHVMFVEKLMPVMKDDVAATLVSSVKLGLASEQGLAYCDVDLKNTVKCGTPLLVEIDEKSANEHTHAVVIICRITTSKKRFRLLRSHTVDLKESRKVYTVVPGEPGEYFVQTYAVKKDDHPTMAGVLGAARGLRNKPEKQISAHESTKIKLNAEPSKEGVTTSMKPLTAYMLALGNVPAQRCTTITKWNAFIPTYNEKLANNELKSSVLPKTLVTAMKKVADLPEDATTDEGAFKLFKEYFDQFKTNGFSAKNLKKWQCDLVQCEIDENIVRAKDKNTEKTPKKAKAPEKEKEKRMKPSELKTILKAVRENGVKIDANGNIDYPDLKKRTQNTPNIDLLPELIKTEETPEWVTAQQGKDLSTIRTVIKETTDVTAYLNGILETAGNDPSPHTTAPIRQLWKLLEKKMVREKLPSWWKAKENLDLLKGFRTHGKCWMATVWDKNLAFYPKAEKECKPPSADETPLPNASICPRFPKKCAIAWDTLVKVSRKELDIPVEVEPTLQFKKEAKPSKKPSAKISKKRKAAEDDKSDDSIIKSPKKPKKDKAVKVVKAEKKEKAVKVEKVEKAVKTEVKKEKVVKAEKVEKVKKVEKAVVKTEKRKAEEPEKESVKKQKIEKKAEEEGACVSPEDKDKDVSEPETVVPTPTPIETPTPKQAPIREKEHPEPIVLDVDESIEY